MGEEREDRILLALEEYLRDHNRVPGVGIEFVAWKYNIYQNQLKKVIAQYEQDKHCNELEILNEVIGAEDYEDLDLIF